MLKRLFLIACLLLPLSAKAAVPLWDVAADKSTLSFNGKQMGTAFRGQFKKFTPVIRFDENHLDKSKVTVDIDLSSVDSGDVQRDDAVKGIDWFEIRKFPSAHFESTAFLKTPAGDFEALGNLTIHGVTVPVKLPFKLVFSTADSGKQSAVMTGNLLLDRSKFKLGRGEWADPSAVANEIAVDIMLTATQR